LAINIDLEEFTIALQSGSYETSYYLNVETGSVAPLSDGEFYDDRIELDDVDGDDIDALGNYVPIHAVPSNEALTVMEDFVASLPEGTEQIRLSDAINGRGPFTTHFAAAIRETVGVALYFRDARGRIAWHCLCCRNL
jgi:hypothetical protein